MISRDNIFAQTKSETFSILLHEFNCQVQNLNPISNLVRYQINFRDNKMLRACVRACTFPCKRQLVITIASFQSNTTNEARKHFPLTIYSPKASEIQFHESSSISLRQMASRERQQQQHQQKKERTCRRQKSQQ